MRAKGVLGVGVGFLAGGLCVLSVLAAPAIGAEAGGRFWRERENPAKDPPPATVEGLPSLSGLIKAVGPAVVNIFTAKRMHNPHTFSMGPFGIQPPGNGGDDDDEGGNGGEGPMGHALGSGFIVSTDGYIVTNNHVVADTDEIKVRLSDGREFPGKLIGRDPQIDVGLIKIEAKDLPTVPLGDSDKMTSGDWVVAMGNPMGLDHSSSVGIISGLGRNLGIGRYDALLQTDAAINPGNSGGPLFNLKGEVVGINTAIVNGANSLCFAVPINMAKEVLPDLKEKGKAVRGKLGVLLRAVDMDTRDALALPSTDGAMVERVYPGTPADRAGIKAGDVITRIDGTTEKDVKDVQRAVARTRPGTAVALTVIRKGKTQTVNAKVDEFTEDTVAMSPREEKEPDATGSKLGVAVAPLTPDARKDLKIATEKGVVVRGVKQGGPAEAAGIKTGDVIIAANNREIASPDEFKREIDKASGKPLYLSVERQGETMMLRVDPQKSRGLR